MLIFESNNNIDVMYYSNINTLTNINKCNTIKYIYDYLIQIQNLFLIYIKLLMLIKYKDLYKFSRIIN